MNIKITSLLAFIFLHNSICLSSYQSEGISTIEETDKTNERIRRVVNGNDADQHEWPWQVSVERFNQHICGGSLIKRDWVLTAAHCIESNKLEQYTVVVGVHSRHGKTAVQKRLSIMKMILHNRYDSLSFVNDIALLRLQKGVQISEGVELIRLPSFEQRAKTGTSCYITGWGRNEHRQQEVILQEAELLIDEPSICQDRMRGIQGVDEKTMICAIGENEGGCQGDSGGPLSCLEGDQWILRGVVSWGHRCSPDYHTVFARVSSYVDWVDLYTVCKDKFSYCKFYSSQCESYGFMRTNCRKTCQFCTPSCFDESSKCSKYRHLCNTMDLMRMLCPDTCDVCSEHEENSCQDKYLVAWCQALRHYGYCGKITDKELCKKTCNHC